MPTQDKSLENLRHSAAHLLAAAVMELWPDTRRTIGPAIENGFYFDFEFTQPISEGDLPKIEKKMREILPSWDKFSRHLLTAAAARKEYPRNPYKRELIKEFSRGGKRVSFYKSGNYWDLCRGGHVKSAREINPEAFKLTKVAGAYWRGSEKNPQLTRIYGVAFNTQAELNQYLKMTGEAEKRDHRILGAELKLFTFSDLVGPGLPLWLPRGTVIRDVIEERAKKVETEWGYQRVATPHIAKEELYKTSGHIPYYADSMYPPMKLDDGNYYLKAMNCPHTHMIYKAEPHSYRDLPLRYAEYGTVYRYELSGTLSGLLRVRGFTQNDAHIYCREDQAEEEFLKVMKLHEYWYKEIFGVTDFYMRLSLPAKDKKKYIDMPKGWKKSVEIVQSAMQKSGLRYVEAEGEAAFYGPKVDFQIKSVIGREETASTNQLDFLAAERFKLAYTDADGKPKPVFVIHRAPLGSHERFIGFLIEHYAGAFPFWLAPVQAVILTLNDKNKPYVDSVAKTLREKGIRLEIDERNESIGKKVRDAELQKIPYLLVIGDREAAAKTVAVRERGKGDLGAEPLEAFLKRAL
ncbi:MAG: threonine--tRNA ligase [Candidatus Sungbacteria bacterium]|uniref:Threonine--tRNA ligase n=1 Tax=Candidatus Sungiibacteriota bacterium TaxID=2750080 RepID=A0A931SDE9_9BACT|nr:threonine--tRNA ligase [Candidatus Sungbacteria bacterium]